MELGNISENIAAVAVVISLIYLALQVRENTRATTLAATRELFSEAQEAIAANSVDDVIAEIWMVGVRDRNRLSQRDSFRFTKVCFGIFAIWEQQYFHLAENFIYQKLFESQLEAYKAALIWPGIRTWWKMAKGGFHEEFRVHVDQLMAEIAEVPPSHFDPELIKAAYNESVESNT